MIDVCIKLLKKIGVDKAIGATTATQLVRFITGPITMLAIVRYMSAEEQGYYYSFAGVMGIQVFLEAGFAQSITQFTTKEFAQLRFNQRGLLTGSTESLSRLRSIFHKANRYYTLMAGVLALGLAVGGYWFFATKESHGVPWQVPWLVCSLCAGLGFVMTPVWSILEGCNRVADVAIYRLWGTIAGFVTTIIALSMGLGIHVATVGAIVSTIFPFLYLFLKWKPFVCQICRKYGYHQVSWKKEIWGFQWRIATTWICRYFLESGIVPLTFQLFGAVSAGQVGMTYQVVRMLGGISNSWTSSKIPMWGALAASFKWSEIESSWSKSATRNVAICFLLVSSFLPVFYILEFLFPVVTSRFLPPFLSLGFMIGTVAYSIWLVCSHYTRALRIEPYIKLHITVAIVFIGTIMLSYKTIGIATIPWSYAAVHALSAGAAVAIRRITRNRHTKTVI